MVGLLAGSVVSAAWSAAWVDSSTPLSASPSDINQLINRLLSNEHGKMIRKQIEELSTNYQFWIRILKHATVALNQICVSVISCLSDYNTTEQIIKIKHSFQLLLEWLIIYLDCPLYNRPCQYQSDVVIEILWDLMIWSQNMQNFCVKFSIDVIAPFMFLSL